MKLTIKLTSVEAVNKATDDRRNKKYGRSVIGCYEIPAAELTELGDNTLNTLIHAVETSDNGRRISGWGVKSSDGTVIKLHFSYFCKATKPSGIISADGAADFFHDHIDSEIRRDLQQAAKAIRRDAEIRVLADDAARLGDWCQSEIVTAAKKACRYEQRLAALHAEMEAEVRQQAGEFFDALPSKVEEHNATHADDQVSDEALSYVQSNRDKFSNWKNDWTYCDVDSVGCR